MRTILNNCVNEIVIKNSRFICYLIPLSDNRINIYLDTIKKEHPKATHYCYAYIYDDNKKSCDDGEPGGTAGIPILNVLEKEKLNYVLAVVVRYFGGIKLGAGGLVRAYTKSVTETLKIADYQELEFGFKVDITFSYEDENNVLYILNNYDIINKEYKENIKYTCLIDKNLIDKLHKYKINILGECLIKKLD